MMIDPRLVQIEIVRVRMELAAICADLAKGLSTPGGMMEGPEDTVAMLAYVTAALLALTGRAR